MLYMWGGQLHRLPENFELPSGGALNAWQDRVCQNQNHGYPPLRTVNRDDMSTPNKRKRFSDLSFLMNILETEARNRGIWRNTQTLVEANDIFILCKGAIEYAELENPNKRRRKGQLKWTTIVNMMRQQRANGDHINEGNEE